jgi:hypothetical protein
MCVRLAPLAKLKMLADAHVTLHAPRCGNPPPLAPFGQFINMLAGEGRYGTSRVDRYSGGVYSIGVLDTCFSR